ncbi:G2/mitotic-specific cyclin-A [Stylophora pistillata]|uniref:G2/mitotic-specific cyclin-A n=1 Tax=Stylophora pistillata TaxID=50429 RepID=A0A2B4R3Z0_STYPI|nr:G2/mitotic-specific cyclin-A [Stylophora pistillata]
MNPTTKDQKKMRRAMTISGQRSLPDTLVMSVLRGKLQLVRTACMLIAAKFEEIYPPDISDFVYITDDTYTAKQVLKMESLILKTLGFEVCSPTILNFLERFLKATECPEADKSKVESLTKRKNEQFCDVTLDVGVSDDRARLKAHGNVLSAASPLFYSALNNDMKEGVI